MVTHRAAGGRIAGDLGDRNPWNTNGGFRIL
jgi:hypothetical protein